MTTTTTTTTTMMMMMMMMMMAVIADDLLRQGGDRARRDEWGRGERGLTGRRALRCNPEGRTCGDQLHCAQMMLTKQTKAADSRREKSPTASIPPLHLTCIDGDGSLMSL
jgi:hypothetical protein